MKLNKAVLWFPSLVVLAGCPGGGGDPQLSTVTVTCTPASVAAGQTSQCTASARDQDGEPFTVSSYSWTSTNESVATVDTTGKATTLTAGTASITASATADGVTKQGQATLTVTGSTAGTIHTEDITANQTWRASGNPHVVRGYLSVGGASAATLTLEAGVEVRFEQDYELHIDTNGALKAMGTAEAPIRMVSSQPSPTKGSWRGLVFDSAGSASELNHVTLSHCGTLSGEDACIAITNRATPVLRHVTVQDSGAMGVEVADDGSAFGAGSTTLTVLRSESYAVRTGANAAGTIPTGGTFTDNVPNAVELHGDVSRTQTWPNLGIPYVLNDYVNVEAASGPTLTLPAGTVLRFGANYALSIGDNAPGGLIVDGTAAAPVLFTADSLSPSPGHWRGLHLGSQTSNTSRVSHATLEYAGAGGSIGTGNLNLYGNNTGGGPRFAVNNVVVQKSSEYGVYLDYSGAFGPGSTVLTARDNGGYAIRVEANHAGSIPTGGTFTGNAVNAVDIREGNVTTTQTWPNLGIPYVVNNFVRVGAASNPRLTLVAGTEVRFSQGYEIEVGGSQPGSLVAVGTAAARIRFIQNTATPTQGHWRGLHFWDAGGSRLDYVTVTHAGEGGSIGTGNVNVYREIGGFVTNSALNNSSGCGITVSDGGYTGSTPVTTNFTLATYNNTFSGNTGANMCEN